MFLALIFWCSFLQILKLSSVFVSLSFPFLFLHGSSAFQSCINLITYQSCKCSLSWHQDWIHTLLLLVCEVLISKAFQKADILLWNLLDLTEFSPRNFHWLKGWIVDWETVYKSMYQAFSLDIMNCNPTLCPSLYFYSIQGAFQAMVWLQCLSRKWLWCFRVFYSCMTFRLATETISLGSCFAIHLWCRNLKAASFHQGMLLGKISRWKWDIGVSLGTCVWVFSDSMAFFHWSQREPMACKGSVSPQKERKCLWQISSNEEWNYI